jgi:Yip1-like protein/zinc ribbon protein
MFCAQCGKSVPDGARFCSHCGASVAAAAPAAPEPAPTSAAAIAPRPEPMAGSQTTSEGTSGAHPGPRLPLTADAAQGLIARVKNILVSPKTEWPVIAAESSSASAIYMGYVAPLVAIGVIATFIGQSMVGLPLLGRVGMVAGLAHAIISFVLSFVGVFLIAWIVDLLAPTFGGQRDPQAALKVTVYSFTPGWVAGVLNLIPMLGVLGIIAALYGLYLLYLGLPVLMRCPADKSVGYTVVTVICAIVMWIVIGALTTCAVGGLGLMGIGAMSRLGAHADRASSADAAAVLSNVFGGKSDADKARVNEALQTLEKMGEQAKQAETAAKAGGAAGTQPGAPGPADVTAALGAVGQIMAGGKDVRPVDFHKLKDLLPESLPGMQRKEASGQSGEAMGFKGSSATASYSDGANASITIEIADMGSLSGLAGLAAKFDPSMEKETDTGYERTRKVDGQLVHERYDRRYKNGEVGVILGDRFAVTVRGNGVEPEALTVALKQVDLPRLASTAR